MDDLNILYSEYERLENHLNQSQLENLSLFLKEIFLQCSTFYKEVNKTIEKFFSKKNLTESHSKMGQNLNFFYQNSLIYLDGFKKMTEKLSKNIIEPLEKYQINLSNQEITSMKNLEILISKYKKSKDEVENSKKSYYISCESFSKTDNNQEFLFEKNKAKKENFYQIYNYEIINANSLYKDYNKEYNKIYQQFQKDEEKRLNFISYCLNSFVGCLENLSSLNNDIITQMKSKLRNWEINDEMNLYNDEFNYTDVNKNRFADEIFEDFNEKSYSKILEQDNNKNKENFLTKSKKIFSFFNESNNNNNNEYNEEYQLKLISNINKYLESEDELNIQTIIVTNKIILQNKNFSFLFMRKFIDKHNKKYFKIKNFNNLKHLNNIFNTIIANIDNIDNNENDFNNLSYAIVNLSIMIYSFDKANNHNVYLCSILGKNTLFKVSEFWNSIFECKLKYTLDIIVKQIMEKDKKKQKIEEAQIQQQETPSSTSSNLKLDINKNLKLQFKGIGTGIKKLFSKEEPKVNNDNINISESSMNSSSITSSSTNDNNNNSNINNNNNDENKPITQRAKKQKNNQFIKFLKFNNYENLSQELKNEFNKKCLDKFNSIIYEFIKYFIDLKWGLPRAVEFVVNLGNKFYVSTETINYYVTYLNSYSYSIRQYSTSLINDYDVNLNIENIRKGKYDNILIKYPMYTKFNELSNENICNILNNILPFLKNKDKINFFLLNKSINHLLSRKIYKIILEQLPINNDNNIFRFKIWENLLSTKEIKNKYNYFDELKKISSIEYDYNSNCSFSIIDLDVSRTLFNENVDESRKAITSVLKTLTTLIPDPSYCQGMNFIASFLYKITKDEERVFYLMMGLFKNTKFIKLFNNELDKLKFYFKVFENIINLFLPNLGGFLSNNSAQTNFFSSAWFITIFTSTVGFNTYLDCIIKIFDYFLLYGWKAVFNVGYTLLEMEENNILELKEENILQFLSSEITKKIFYGDKKISEIFFQKIKNMKIKKKIIRAIKNQIKIEENIKENKDE